MTATDGKSSYSYVIPVVIAVIIIAVVVGVIAYYRYHRSKERRRPNGENLQEQEELVNISQNTSSITFAA